MAEVKGRDVAPGQPGQLGAQFRAVVFDDEYIVAAALVQVGRVAVLGVQRIGGDDGAGEIDPIQQWREGGDLVALVVDLGLAQHDTAGVFERGEQMPCWLVGGTRTTGGLAVHGDCSQRLVRLSPQARTLDEPGRHRRVQRVRVDGLQDSAKRGLTRGAPADPKPDPHRNRQVMSPFRDPHIAARSGQHRAHRRG